MPEQVALPDLVLSTSFKRCQRALAQWLEQQPGASFSLAAVRKAMRSLSDGESRRLLAWLDFQRYAARHNRNRKLAARIERLTAHLGHATGPGAVRLQPAAPAVAITGLALPRSA